MDNSKIDLRGSEGANASATISPAFLEQSSVWDTGNVLLMKQKTLITAPTS
jgi:hypothetical protein